MYVLVIISVFKAMQMSFFLISIKNKFDVQLNFAAIHRFSAENTKNGRFLRMNPCNNDKYHRMLCWILTFRGIFLANRFLPIQTE